MSEEYLDDFDPNEEPAPDPDLEPRPKLRIYFAADVLFGRPEMLGMRVEGITFVVVDRVAAALENHALLDGPARIALNTLKQAISNGSVVTEPCTSGHFPLGKLSEDNTDLLRHLYPQRDHALLVSDDMQLIWAAGQVGIEAVTGARMAELLLERKAVRDQAVADRSRYYALAVLVMAIPTASVLLGFSYLIAQYGPDFLKWTWERLNALVVLLTPVVGYGLLIWKVRKPLSYGSIEVLFGTAAIWLAVLKLQEAKDHTLATALAFGTGLYIVVRGLESIKKGSKKTSLWKLFAWFTPKDALAEG